MNMRRVVALLLHLYPRRWQQRYGSELLTLAEDARMKGPDAVDVLKGAFLMRVHDLGRRPAWHTLLAMTLLGALAGGIATKAMRTQYVSTAVFTVEAESRPASTRHATDLFRQAYPAEYLATIIHDLKLYPHQRGRMPLPDVAKSMQRDIRLSAASGWPSSANPVGVSLAFTYEDGPMAQRVANMLVERIIAINRAAPPAANVKVLQRASLPLFPTSPVVWRVIATGALAGLLAGVLVSSTLTRGRFTPAQGRNA